MVKSRPVLSFGTLATPLAKSQTQAVISQLQHLHPRLTCQMTIVTSPLAVGAHTREPYLAASAAEVEYLEEMLLADEFRFVVQRAADLVIPLREGVTIAAVPPRDTPFDAFLNRQGLIPDEMPDKAIIGVINLRTKAQMKALWPRLDYRIVKGGLEGALESFLRLCDLDGLVVPAAVTEHLGIQGIVTEIIYPELMLPSSGQGILVILGKESDDEGRHFLKDLHSDPTNKEMDAEHAFMQRFTSDQDLPLSVLAQVEAKRIIVTGSIGSLRGNFRQYTVEGPVTSASQLGTDLAERLLLSGEAFIDLLEADFPEGLPEQEIDDVLAGEGLISDTLATDEEEDTLSDTDLETDPPDADPLSDLPDEIQDKIKDEIGDDKSPLS